MTVSPAVLKDLAPTGRLRAANHHGTPVLAQNHADGTLGGVTVALARELGKRLDVPVDLIPFDAAGKVFAAIPEKAWDIAFLAIEPVRAAEIEF
ncbi:MAG: ABC transporter substrate-binding protein, partial [Pseudolabrys sp.]